MALRVSGDPGYDYLCSEWGTMRTVETYRGYEIFVHEDGKHRGARTMRMGFEIACFIAIEGARKSIDSWVTAKEKGLIPDDGVAEG